jgi:hypothetical protein
MIKNEVAHSFPSYMYTFFFETLPVYISYPLFYKCSSQTFHPCDP